MLVPDRERSDFSHQETGPDFATEDTSPPDGRNQREVGARVEASVSESESEGVSVFVGGTRVAVCVGESVSGLRETERGSRPAHAHAHEIRPRQPQNANRYRSRHRSRARQPIFAAREETQR